MKVFTADEVCIPSQHYMVDISDKLKEIKKLIDEGKYFTINRGKKYGKTTVLTQLSKMLMQEYYVVLLNFKEYGEDTFLKEDAFCRNILVDICSSLSRQANKSNNDFVAAVEKLSEISKDSDRAVGLFSLFHELLSVLDKTDRPIVLLIDNIDGSDNMKVMCEFLEQLRARYIARDANDIPTFHSAILTSATDIKILQELEMPEDKYLEGYQWNLASDIDVDLHLSCAGIKGMLDEYEVDHNTGMNTEEMAAMIWNHTEGYPIKVSRLCKIIDEDISKDLSPSEAWSKEGFDKAVKKLD